MFWDGAGQKPPLGFSLLSCLPTPGLSGLPGEVPALHLACLRSQFPMPMRALDKGLAQTGKQQSTPTPRLYPEVGAGKKGRRAVPNGIEQTIPI